MSQEPFVPLVKLVSSTRIAADQDLQQFFYKVKVNRNQLDELFSSGTDSTPKGVHSAACRWIKEHLNNTRKGPRTWVQNTPPRPQRKDPYQPVPIEWIITAVLAGALLLLSTSYFYVRTYDE